MVMFTEQSAGRLSNQINAKEGVMGEASQLLTIYAKRLAVLLTQASSPFKLLSLRGGAVRRSNLL